MRNSASSVVAAKTRTPAQAWLLVLKIVVSLGTLVFVIASVDWRQALAMLRGIDLQWMIVALAVFWLAQLVSSWRCVCAARTLGGVLHFATSVKAHFIGMWFNQIMPSSLGGDVVKVGLLRQTLGLGLAVRAAFIDRFSGLLFLMLATAVLLPAYDALFPNRPMLTLFLGILSLASLLLTALAAWVGSRGARRFRDRPLAVAALAILDDLWRFRRLRELAPQLWTSAIVHCNGIATYALLGIALGISVDVLTFCLVVPLVFLVAVIPLSFAGWGVREAGAIWLFGSAGVGRESALAISVCYGLFLIAASTPGLLLLALPGRTGQR